jgi:hypothetical protein
MKRVVLRGLLLVVLLVSFAVLGLGVMRGVSCQQLSDQYVAAMSIPANNEYDRGTYVQRRTVIDERRAAYTTACA